LQQELRRAVLDPILVSLDEAITTLYFAVDEALELVPLDALAQDDGSPVGSAIALRPLSSLLELLEQDTGATAAEPTLLVCGGLDYGKARAGLITAVGQAAAPMTTDLRSGQPTEFGVLQGTAGEAEGIGELFAAALENGIVRLLSGDRATKAALLAQAPSATYLHLATHGYFAPESVASIADHRGVPLALDQEQRITGLSPLVLTGLALSGANLPPDDLGSVPGIITAEELLSLDLSACHLVTLSACDTSLGVRRAGQGYASLRSALQGAGARYVLTSLWKVGDEATEELMLDFYRRLWVDEKDPHRALWEARMAVREHGAA
jgi:CHAT domain-containing protein